MRMVNVLAMKANMNDRCVTLVNFVLYFCIVACTLMAGSCERQSADVPIDDIKIAPRTVMVDTLRQCLSLGTGVLFSNGQYLLSLNKNAIGDVNLEWLLDDFGPEATTVAISDDWCPYPKPNASAPDQIKTYAAGFYYGWRFEMDSVMIHYRRDLRVIQVDEMFHGCKPIVRNPTSEYLHGYEEGREVANRVFAEFCRHLLVGNEMSVATPQQPCDCDFQ